MSSPPLIAAHVGREQDVAAAGRTYTLARWERVVWFEFLQWARTVLPNPKDVVRPLVKGLALERAQLLAAKDAHAAEALDDIAKVIVREALDESLDFLSVNSPRVQKLLQTLEGMLQILWLLLRKHHPQATLDDAWEIFDSLGVDRVLEVLNVASGKNPPQPVPEGNPTSPPSSGAGTTGS